MNNKKNIEQIYQEIEELKLFFMERYRSIHEEGEEIVNSLDEVIHNKLNRVFSLTEIV